MRNSLSIKSRLAGKFFKDSQIPELTKKSDGKPANEKLNESEIRYRRLFESAKDGILILDFKSGEIIDANPFIVKMIDFPLEEIIGRKLWEIGLFSNKEESEVAFTELKTNGYIRFEDMPIQRKNGKITEVEFISNVYLENDNKVIQCNIRDISARKQAEHALKISEQNLKMQNTEYHRLNNEYSALNEELIESIKRVQNINNKLISANVKAEESDKLKSAFLANMSHEIRTPMNAIMGFSQFLLQPGLSNEKLRDFVQIINTSSLQLLTVISDIIDISKIESDQITISSEYIIINDLLNELFVTYEKLAEQKDLSLYYSHNHSNEHIQLYTDGNRIRQVICNLMNNAIKFTKKGRIEFGYHIKAGFLEFYVRDTGIGIATKDQSLIFKRFRQVEATENMIYGGNGLGLSISKALVEKLGGTICVDSILGAGSTFTFTIPYIKKQENNTFDSALKAVPGRYNNWQDKMILIVEDDVNNHAYIEELLSETDVRIVHAWDGNEAVEQVKKHTDISLVLMDIKMPIMNGFEATLKIKQIRPKLPVIAQTALSISHGREQAIEAGCDNYIPKPVPKNVFVDLIANYLS